MSNYQIVSFSTHSTKKWLRYSNYKFAAGDAIAPLAPQEIPKAALSLPIAFTQTPEGFQVVAVLGLFPGENLWVDDQGRWNGGYIPAVYRAHPFLVGRTSDGQTVLCFDIDSGLLSDTQGETFFTDEGSPSEPVTEVMNFLTQLQSNQAALNQILAVLNKHGLMQRWGIKVSTRAGEHMVNGLYAIDEQLLNNLDIAALDELRQSGALPLIYCQLISMQHLSNLKQLAQTNAHGAIDDAEPDELDLDFLNSGTINFNNLA